MGVALVLIVDPGDDHGVEVGEKEFVNLRPSDDVNHGVEETERGDLMELVDNFHPFGSPRLVSGENNVLAARERFTDRVVGLAPHEDGVAVGGLLEELEILGQAPREVSVFADDPLRGHGHNGMERHGFAHGILRPRRPP